MKNIEINKNLKIVIMSLLLTIISICLLGIITHLMIKNNLKIFSNSLMINVILEITILVVQLLIIKKYSHKKFSLSLIGMKFQKNSLQHIFIGTCIGLICCISVYFTLCLIKISVFKGIGFKFYNSKIVIISIISSFIRAIFAGTCEEIFFRGVLLNYLFRYKGKIFAIIISSIIFLIFHTTRYQNLIELSYVLFMGIVLGYSYIITKSLYFPIGLHFSIDFFTNLVAINEPNIFIFNIGKNVSLNSFEQTIFLLNTIMYLIVLIVLILLNMKINKSSKQKTNDIT